MPYGIDNPNQGSTTKGVSWLGQVNNGIRDLGGALGGAWNWLSGNQGTGALGDDKYFTFKQLDKGSPYVQQQSPYAGQYGQLINMLQNRASGQGPSVAGDAYKSTASDAMSRAVSMSNSGNPGGARLAMQQLGNQEQGMSQGYAAARNQEMQGATGQLGSTINNADSSQLLRDKANQDAWLQMLKDVYGGDQAVAQTSKNNGSMFGSLLQSAAGI